MEYLGFIDTVQIDYNVCINQHKYNTLGGEEGKESDHTGDTAVAHIIFVLFTLSKL